MNPGPEDSPAGIWDTVKFADDTTTVGLITSDDKKSSLSINGEEVETMKNIKYLGVHITNNLTWSVNISQLVRKHSSDCSS